MNHEIPGSPASGHTYHSTASASTPPFPHTPTPPSQPPEQQMGMRADEVMANLERLRQAAAGQVQQSPGNTHADREAEAQEVRQHQQSYYDARTMAPTTSVNDQSGWSPPYMWNHGNPMYMPAIFTHPHYIGSRVPPAMTTPAQIAPEVFAAQRLSLIHI